MNAIPRSLRIEMPARQEELNRLLDRFAAYAAANRIPDGPRREIHLALDEIVSNVIKYGAAGRRGCRIVVDFKLRGGTLRVEVIDNARRFNPFDAPRPATEAAIADRPIGGLGVFLVQRLMDAVQYRWSKGQNHLVMRRDLERAGRPALA
jgi:anti-sigma regulatory factor (Ser/Thr protein kinase)